MDSERAEVEFGEGVEEITQLEEEEYGNEEENLAMITICAQTNLQTSIQTQLAKTFKFKGYIGNTPVCVLIDSGSTHSFVNPEIIQTPTITTIQTEPMMVTIANDTQMNCTQICKNLKFAIQDQEFEMDLRVMKVPGYDVILGIDWLASTGVMTVDWGKGFMKFQHKGKTVKLQVKEERAEVRLNEITLNIEKEKKNGSQVVVAHLFCSSGRKLETDGVLLVQEQSYPVPVAEILREFESVFEEPQSLPLIRSVDHRIVLKPEAKPISLRPYRMSYFQRLEVEKIIEELLKNSFIQPSTSPYASPILWLRKKMVVGGCV